MNTVEKKAWRMAIRDKKDWTRWQFSKEYDSLDDLFEASKNWLQEHPGRVIQFQSRTYWAAE